MKTVIWSLSLIIGLSGSMSFAATSNPTGTACEFVSRGSIYQFVCIRNAAVRISRGDAVEQIVAGICDQARTAEKFNQCFSEALPGTAIPEGYSSLRTACKNYLSYVQKTIDTNAKVKSMWLCEGTSAGEGFQTCVMDYTFTQKGLKRPYLAIYTENELNPMTLWGAYLDVGSKVQYSETSSRPMEARKVLTHDSGATKLQIQYLDVKASRLYDLDKSKKLFTESSFAGSKPTHRIQATCQQVR